MSPGAQARRPWSRSAVSWAYETCDERLVGSFGKGPRVPTDLLTTSALIARVRELEPWYQDIELRPGITTKSVPDVSTIGLPDTPGRLWRIIAPHLDSLKGKRVLDIGCNAGYMAFACERAGAIPVLGIDEQAHFIRQAEFVREVLALNAQFSRVSLYDFAPEEPFDVVLFCGVLYHLENWADGLDCLHGLVTRRGMIVLETAIEPLTQTFYGEKEYYGDKSTYFVPSLSVLRALLLERGYRITKTIEYGGRAALLLRM
jgi:SAM-dependent methyltransferase